MKKGVFQKLREFLFGERKIEEFGGEVGGYSYLILRDVEKREMIGYFVTPPRKSSKEVSGKVEGIGGLASVGVNYKSEYDYGETIAYVNKDATLQPNLTELEKKINETRMPEQQITTKTTMEMRSDERFFAGPYITTVGANTVEAIKLEAHFDRLQPRMVSGLSLILGFITESNFGIYVKGKRKNRNATFRSAIFLPDIVKGELRICASYNMQKHPDEHLALRKGDGVVSHVYEKGTHQLADLKASKSDSFGDMSHYRIWENLRSILAMPILDSNDTCLGVLSVDTDLPYTAAGFDRQGMNDVMYLAAKGIGYLLEVSA